MTPYNPSTRKPAPDDAPLAAQPYPRTPIDIAFARRFLAAQRNCLPGHPEGRASWEVRRMATVCKLRDNRLRIWLNEHETELRAADMELARAFDQTIHDLRTLEARCNAVLETRGELDYVRKEE